MKKILFFVFISTMLSITPVLGQLKVHSNGNVTIKPNSTATALSPLSVGDTGEQNVTVTVRRVTSQYDLRALLAGRVQVTGITQ